MSMTAEERQRLERLEAVVGGDWWKSRKDWPTLQAEPRAELPSGDYPLYFRIRELGNAVDADVAAVAQFGVDLEAMKERLTQFDGQTPSEQPAPIADTPPQGIAGQKYFASQHSVTLNLESDLSKSNPQRPTQGSGKDARSTTQLVLAKDGGYRELQNLEYLADGTAHIPDPTRFGVTWGNDREGMMSVNLHVPEKQPDANGFYRIKGTHKGQLLVIIPDMNGDVTLRFPQGGDLYIEKGSGGMNPDGTGHTHTVSRRKVLTESVEHGQAKSNLKETRE